MQATSFCHNQSAPRGMTLTSGEWDTSSTSFPPASRFRDKIALHRDFPLVLGLKIWQACNLISLTLRPGRAKSQPSGLNSRLGFEINRIRADLNELPFKDGRRAVFVGRISERLEEESGRQLTSFVILSKSYRRKRSTRPAT
ncbi:hypothetical protein Pla8534_68290 [Lignipirellula cremea]|uniref:Uncharacterized protein n=1 Tax=Lignipirellula cremea TaxID=2528010 RepID=A0A518E4C6_9BACT|nr:hypothetical protein Pla8534_68290 [Lignipirellula cremea]